MVHDMICKEDDDNLMAAAVEENIPVAAAAEVKTFWLG